MVGDRKFTSHYFDGPCRRVGFPGDRLWSALKLKGFVGEGGVWKTPPISFSREIEGQEHK